MMIMFRCSVVADGTPGPLLGDGVNTIVTMLYPATLTHALDTLGERESVINSASSPRKSYTVARAIVLGAGDNADEVYLLARGATSATARRMAPYEELTPLGFGDHNDIDLGDFDVDAVTSGDDIVVWAEVR